MMNNHPIKYLYTNGCSWTCEHGISSDPNFPHCDENEKYTIATRFSWPNLVASHFNASLKNDAAGGGSNSRIVRTTCDFIRKFPPENRGELMVVIGWTAPERDEIYIEYNEHKSWHLFNPSLVFSNQFSKQDPPYPPHVMSSIDDYHKIYTRLIQNDRADFIKFFNQIFLLSNLLENLGVKFLFFSSIGFPQMRSGPSVFDVFENDFSRLSHKKYMGIDKNKTMAGFCHENSVPLSPCIHPMILGHQLWSRNIISTINEIF